MWNRSNHIEDEKLDRLGDELLRAFEPSEAEINSAATSPFLYRRIRVRIEAEERRRAEERNPWLTLLVTARRAIPAFALIALLAASWQWVSPDRSGNRGGEIVIAELPVLSADLANDDFDASLVGWQRVDQGKSEEMR